MKLLFKERLFSWLDSYDVYDEDKNTIFTVKGVLAWKHCFKIYNANGQELGSVREKLLTFLRPRFDLEIQGRDAGSITKEISLFRPKFSLDFRDWRVEGNWLEWNYQITSPAGVVATISKQIFCFSDTYEIDLLKPEDALEALMVVIAIDAVKCSQSDK